jgi:hypothetical protein
MDLHAILASEAPISKNLCFLVPSNPIAHLLTLPSEIRATFGMVHGYKLADECISAHRIVGLDEWQKKKTLALALMRGRKGNRFKGDGIQWRAMGVDDQDGEHGQ